MGTPKKINAKVIDTKVTIVINGKKLTKDEKDKMKRQAILNKIELFNKKPTEARFHQIVNIFDTKKIEKEAKVAKVKGVKKAIKKSTTKEAKKETKKREVKREAVMNIIKKAESEILTDQEITDLEALLKKQREAKGLAPKAEVAPVTQQRRGEY